MEKISERLVAIKSIIKQEINAAEMERTMFEMKLLKDCDHQHVVRVFDSFETAKHVCFVMELCCGGDL